VLEPLGFDIAEAGSGEECLARVREQGPSLVLLDLMMSDMSGIDAAGRLRAAGWRGPIVVVSANAYPADRRRAFAAGCDDFLAKPIQIPDLLQRLKLHLGLDWVYRKDKPAPGRCLSSDDEAMALPPAGVVKDLAACAKIGDLRGLTDRLKMLIEEDLKYLPYARYLQGLAKEFRLADIKKLLASEGGQPKSV
jgi:CheY-like chemotaxis protein